MPKCGSYAPETQAALAAVIVTDTAGRVTPIVVVSTEVDVASSVGISTMTAVL